MLKYFTQKAFSRSIAINPDRVIFVEDLPNRTTIKLVENNEIEVNEDYMTVVARLNERD